LCCAHLALGDRLHAGPHDFAEVRGFEHHEGHDAGGERPDRGVFAGVVYFIISFSASLLVKRLQKRFAV
jgi:hypothetical protein